MSTELLTHYRSGLEHKLAHRTTLTFPSALHIRDVLLEVYAAVTNHSLPTEPLRNGYWDGDEHLDVAFLDANGNGYLQLHESRGFMPGMGQTITCYLLVHDHLRITVSDWWEDNIADPDEYDFNVAACSAEELDRAAKALAAAGQRGLKWKDSYASPNRPARAEVEAVISVQRDPALAWQELANKAIIPAGIVVNLAWVYVHEQQRFDHPPTLRHVEAFGADGRVATRLDDAMATLIARLLPWGGADPRTLEWILEAPFNTRYLHIPACIAPVFDALRTDIDPTLPRLTGAGWFAHGREAWRAACAVPHLAYAQRPDPFEPLGQILEAGYYADVTPEAARLFGS